MAYEEQIIKAVEKNLPGVVSIAITKDLEAVEASLPFPMQKNMLRDEIPLDEEGKVKIGGGSGFIVSSNGIVLTNKHVIMDPEAHHTVLDQEGKRYSVKVLARDPIHDIAILKIDSTKKFPTVTLGDAKNLRLGQSVIAIGNVLGEFQSTVSTGVVSGLSRFITAITDISGHQERLRGLIQTDAAINPGNSGGPLVNIQGEVIGINAAVVFGAQNIGFAIPIDKATRDLEDIKNFGHIKRPFLGIRYLILNQALQKRFGFESNYGALVVKENVPGDHAVVPGSAAEKAGIKESDILLTCNNRAITEKETLEDILEDSLPGEKIAVTLLRQGNQKNLILKLEEWGNPAI